jgi:hypothetical protein
LPARASSSAASLRFSSANVRAGNPGRGEGVDESGRAGDGSERLPPAEAGPTRTSTIIVVAGRVCGPVLHVHVVFLVLGSGDVLDDHHGSVQRGRQHDDRDDDHDDAPPVVARRWD